MKINQIWIILACMILFFTSCERENGVRDEIGVTKQTGNFDLQNLSLLTSTKEWLFDTDGSSQGWTIANANGTVSGGTFNLTATGTDPFIVSPNNLAITTPATHKFVHFDMKNNTSVTSARVYFTTNADSTWSQAKSKAIALKTNTNYYGSYIVDMSTGTTGWSGTIKRIRIDFLDVATSGQTVNIDYVKLTDNRPLRGVMSPVLGFSLAHAQILNNWKVRVMRWQINSLSTTWPTTIAAYDAWLSNEMAELDSAFAWCAANNVKILIDLHYTPLGNDGTNGSMIYYNQAANDKVVSVWQTLANRYKDKSNLYGYDLVNEPVQNTTPLVGCDFKSTYIKIGQAIRAIDRKTPIHIAVDNWDNPGNFSTFTPVPLTNVIYHVHMYLPQRYTHQRIGSFNADYAYPGTIGAVYYDKARLITELAPVRNFQINYAARIFVGEFSAARWAVGASLYLRDNMEIFESYGWEWTYHAFKEASVWNLEHINGTPNSTPVVGASDRYTEMINKLSLNP